MSYRIEYFRGGKIIGALVSHVPMEQAMMVAADGLMRHDADFVRLLDIDAGAAEIWTKRRKIP